MRQIWLGAVTIMLMSCVPQAAALMKNPLQEAGSGKKKARTDKRAG